MPSKLRSYFEHLGWIRVAIGVVSLVVMLAEYILFPQTPFLIWWTALIVFIANMFLARLNAKRRGN